ncbi:MAG: chromate transporter [Clostridia bacterium]|nr:chromate transporter [Clostridia bacterium]
MKLLFQLFFAFFRIGALTFGGGYAMLPMFKKELVEKHGWCTEEDILDYYAIAQCTPGVIAVNTASFIGFKKKGVVGAIFSTLGVVAPSILIITVIAAFINHFADNAYVAHAFAGIRIAVCALVSVTIFGLLKKNVKDILTALLAIAAFVVTYFFGLSPIIAVFVAATAGIIASVIREKNRNSVEKEGKK